MRWQVRREVRQAGEIEGQLGDGQLVTVSSQRVLQPVCLGRYVVDDNDRRGLFILGVCPPLVFLVGAAFVHRRFDGTARTADRHQFGVDPDTIVKRVVAATGQQPLKRDRASHDCMSPPKTSKDDAMRRPCAG